MTEHRKHERQRLDLPVAYQAGDGPRLDAVCKDVSLGGMFIVTESPLPFGTSLTVYLKLTALRQEAVIRAVVRWTKPGGMGVQFGTMGARETHALMELLASE